MHSGRESQNESDYASKVTKIMSPFLPTVCDAMRRGQSLGTMPLVYIATSAASSRVYVELK